MNGDDKKHAGKPTVELEQLAIIRGLLDRQAAKSDAMDAKIDAHRAESAKRGQETADDFKKLEGLVDTVRTEVKRLNQRMSTAESDIRALKDSDASIERHQSDASLEHEAALGGAIAHVRTLEGALADIKSECGELRGNDETQKRVDRAICQELGLDYDTVAATDEPTKPDALKKTKLTAIARENKLGVGVGIVVLVLQIVLEAIRHIH